MKYIYVTEEKVEITSADILASKIILDTLKDFRMFSVILAPYVMDKLDKLKEIAETSEEVSLFISQYSQTLIMLKSEVYRFPPGHPIEGKLYRKHPVSHEHFGSTYIPYETFDEFLLKERESELISLLTDIGATRVKITDNQESLVAGNKSSKANAGIGDYVSAEYEKNKSEETSSSRRSEKVFECEGVKWGRESKVDKNKYNWLAFENDWKDIVKLRETAGCTHAQIALSQSNAFSNESDISAEIKLKILGGEYSKREAESQRESKSWTLTVDFSKPEV